MSQILVVNAGSSSLKYALVDPGSGTHLISGIIERIGLDVTDHATAFRMVSQALADAGGKEPSAVGHRVVHGGDRFSAPALITTEVMAAIEDNTPLAPLHNPPALVGIHAAVAEFPDVPQVAVFDTAFHSTIPPVGSTYAIGRDVAREYRLRRYGFHGTSHQYVSVRAADFLDLPLQELRIITLHLGNGASACAIDAGRSVDTSMGVTPLEGLVMGTRSGDLDPAIPGILGRLGWTPDKIDSFLNKSSGLLGMCGASDLREIARLAADGDADADLARRVAARRIAKYVGAYAAVLDGVDVIVFTAGIGEHDAWIRAEACRTLGFLGVRMDQEANLATVGPASAVDISASDSTVRVLVVPTDEEHAIAEQTAGVVNA
jgi:acetate kinase